ncbi:MAG: ABC transporter permease subunit, partial [Spirochaetia bacterium]|nr:ABC transporter permease subunit [Spirochaetia bacterium]
IGYLLLWFFSPRGWIGSGLARAGWPVAFHWSGAVVAAAVVGFPLLVFSIALSMKSIDPGLELASRMLGASKIRTFFRITLPLAWPGILSGAALAFARGIGEFGATIVLAGRIPGATETIPLAIYAELDAPGGEARIGYLVLASILICLACVFLARILDQVHRKRLEIDP